MTVPYRVITISSLTCAGATTLAQSLGQRLGWPLSNPVSVAVRAYLKDHQLALADVDQVPDDVHLKFDQILKHEIDHDSQTILIGRTAGWLAQGISDVYRVFVTASLAARSERYASREGVSLGQAHDQLTHLDGSNLVRYKRLYDMEQDDPQWYDLIVDTTNKDASQTLQFVLDHLTQVTP